MNQKRRRRKNFLAALIPFFAIGALSLLLIAGLFGGSSNILPAEEEEVSGYQVIGNQLNVSWEWFMLIDMYQAELSKSEFNKQNPVYTALNCIKVTIEVYSEEEDENGEDYWYHDHTDYANGAEEILNYFGLSTDTTDVNLVVRAIQRKNSEEYRITMETYPTFEEVLNTYYQFPPETVLEMLELEKAHYFSEAYGQDLFNGSDGIFEGEVNAEIPAIGMKIPLYLQGQQPWRGIKFGDGTIATSGCSITSIAMALSYLNGEAIYPDQVAAWAGYKYHIKGVGASHDIFPAAAKRWGVSCTSLGTNMNSVIMALSNGKPVLASMGAGTFTKRGHIIVLRGITADGKILVNDPNDNSVKQHFNKSFDISLIKREGKAFWSYE